MNRKLSIDYIDHAKGRAWYRVSVLFWTDIELPGGCIRLTVPAGFVTDFASTPRWLWWILPPTGEYMEDALVHDWLYSSRCPRFLADAIFRALMERRGVSLWKRVVMFYCVRLFGGFYRRKPKPFV